MFKINFSFKDEILIKDLNIKMSNLNEKKKSKKHFVFVTNNITDEIASDFVSKLLKRNLK
jgi:hypothetical protein